ncbi:MAG TPA: SRPBCC family protein [Saprospiraceae bacterium]|nr:SRPBCC family protein [Saprospiraceae bacterium]
MNTDKITVQAILNANRSKAWDYYTQPEHITKWNFASDDWCCPSAINDLRAGGRYSARMEARDGSVGFDFEAVYDEVLDGEALGYTMTDGRQAKVTFDGHGDQTRVTVSFDPEQVHSLELQRAGWQAILDNFKSYADRQG